MTAAPMTATPMTTVPASAPPSLAQDALQQALTRLEAIILGKTDELRLALCCLLARGHLLIEDVPGVGKTTLALALARVLGLGYSRIQFTSDLLPADVLGISVFEPAHTSFRFHPGPIFANLVLADEINRASPKTQSALLEAMEEQQVSGDGHTLPLPQPFFVIATQNPAQQVGTFALPESQLDRFLMRIQLGYPPAVAEKALLMQADRRDLLADIEPAFSRDTLIALQKSVNEVRIAPALADYLIALLHHSRAHHVGAEQSHARGHITGLSPRGGLALRRAAQAWALMQGRGGVIPEDVQAVFVAVASHRLQAHGDAQAATAGARRILEQVAIP